MAPLLLRVALIAAVAAATSAALLDERASEVDPGQAWGKPKVRRTQSCCMFSLKSAGCMEPVCQQAICANMPSCCTTLWTDVCAAQAIANVSCACKAAPKYLEVDPTQLSFSQLGPNLALTDTQFVGKGRLITSFPRPDGTPYGRLLHVVNAFVDFLSITGLPPSYTEGPKWESDVEGNVAGSIDFISTDFGMPTVDQNAFVGVVWYPPLKAFVAVSGFAPGIPDFGFEPKPAKIAMLVPTGTASSSAMQVMVDSWVAAEVRGLAYVPAFSPSVFGLDITSPVNVVTNSATRNGQFQFSASEQTMLVAGTGLVRFNPSTGANKTMPLYFRSESGDSDSGKPVISQAMTADSCGNIYIWYKLTRVESGVNVNYFGLGKFETLQIPQTLTAVHPPNAFVRKIPVSLIRQGPDFTALAIAMDGMLYGSLGAGRTTNAVNQLLVANKQARQCFCSPTIPRVRPTAFWCYNDNKHVDSCASCSGGCNDPANVFNGVPGNDIYDGTIWHHKLAGSSEVQLDLDPDETGNVITVAGFSLQQSPDPQFQMVGIVVKASNSPDSGFVTVRRWGAGGFGGVVPMPTPKVDMYFALAAPTVYRYWSIVMLHPANDLRLWGVVFDAICPLEAISVDQRRSDEIA